VCQAFARLEMIKPGRGRAGSAHQRSAEAVGVGAVEAIFSEALAASAVETVFSEALAASAVEAIFGEALCASMVEAIFSVAGRLSLGGGEVVGVGAVETIFGECTGSEYREGKGEDQFAFHGCCSFGLREVVCFYGFNAKPINLIKKRKK
jgi:hypothetical protein